MSSLVRILNNKFHWLVEPWCGTDSPSAALGDLRFTDNGLSVYEFEDNDFLERILSAYAGNRDNLQKVDFISFPIKLISDLGLKFVKRPGELPDDAVNNSHYDIEEITASNAAELVNNLLHVGTLDRMSKPKLESCLIRAYQGGHLDRIRMSQGVLQKIERLIGSET